MANKIELPKWLLEAYKLLGQKEIPGPKSNPTIMKLYEEAANVHVNDDSTTPWCAALIGATLARANIKNNGMLAARSYESWGVPLKNPILGCIGIKRRGGNAPAWQGHIGYVVFADKNTIGLLGGNQGDKVSIASFKRSEFTAFRWPANIPVPTNLPLPTTLAGAESNVSQA